jgi:hypothetical protein
MKTYGGVDYSSKILDLSSRWKESGQLHVLATLFPVKSSLGTLWIGGWVDPRVSLDTGYYEVEKMKSYPWQELNPGHPAHNQSFKVFKKIYIYICIYRAWDGAGWVGMASRFLWIWFKSIPFLLRTVTPSRDVFFVLLNMCWVQNTFFLVRPARIKYNRVVYYQKYFTGDISLCRHCTNLRKASFSYY